MPCRYAVIAGATVTMVTPVGKEPIALRKALTSTVEAATVRPASAALIGLTTELIRRPCGTS